jgi:hypothetical protein
VPYVDAISPHFIEINNNLKKRLAMLSAPSLDVSIVSLALINIIILGYHVPASAVRGPA